MWSLLQVAALCSVQTVFQMKSRPSPAVKRARVVTSGLLCLTHKLPSELPRHNGVCEAFGGQKKLHNGALSPGGRGGFASGGAVDVPVAAAAVNGGVCGAHA